MQMQMPMYAHPKRHLPQTETKDKKKQKNMQKDTHTPNELFLSSPPLVKADATRVAAQRRRVRSKWTMPT